MNASYRIVPKVYSSAKETKAASRLCVDFVIVFSVATIGLLACGIDGTADCVPGVYTARITIYLFSRIGLMIPMNKCNPKRSHPPVHCEWSKY